MPHADQVFENFIIFEMSSYVDRHVFGLVPLPLELMQIPHNLEVRTHDGVVKRGEPGGVRLRGTRAVLNEPLNSLQMLTRHRVEKWRPGLNIGIFDAYALLDK
jgi:hypothetical protein